MGNCLPRDGLREDNGLTTIRVVTSNGGIMELHPPITAEHITDGFPCNRLFRATPDLFPQPVLHNEELVGGEVYHLRPLTGPRLFIPSPPAPYRVSFDHHGLRRRQDLQPSVAKYCYGSGGGAGGMWKVKLVIRPSQLAEILAHESRTEALIESVRTVAKCESVAASSSSVAGSDHLSLTSSRKGAGSDNGGLA